MDVSIYSERKEKNTNTELRELLGLETISLMIKR